MRWWSNSACLKTLVRSTSHAAIAFIKLWHFSRFDASLPDSQCLKSMQNMQVLNLRPCTMLLGGAAAMQSYHMLLWSTMVRTWTCHVLFSTCHPETYSGLILLKWWQLLKAWKYLILHSSCSKWLWREAVSMFKQDFMCRSCEGCLIPMFASQGSRCQKEETV